jgi:hypothetical protein
MRIFACRERDRLLSRRVVRRALAAQVGLLLYQVSYLLQALGAAGTSVALMSTTVSSIVGQLALGLVIDNMPQRQVSAAAFATQAGSVAIRLLFQPIQRPSTSERTVRLVYRQCLDITYFDILAGVRAIVIRPTVGVVDSRRPGFLCVDSNYSRPVRDLTAEYRAVLGVFVGLQAVATVVTAFSSISKRPNLGRAAEHGSRH